MEFLFYEEGDAAPCPVWSSIAIQVRSANPDAPACIIEVMAKHLVQFEMNRILLEAAKAKKAKSRKRARTPDRTDARSGPTLQVRSSVRTDPLHTRAKSIRSSVVTAQSCPTTTNDSSQQQQTYGMIQLNGRSQHVGTHVCCEIRLCLSASMMVSMIIS